MSLATSRLQGSQYSVPVCEVRGEVAVKLGVMQVVVRHASIPPKRYQFMRGPGKLIARVVLHRQPDVDHVEDHDGERVTLEQCDVHHVEEAQGKQLPEAHVLRGQRERGRVLVVHLENVPVQPRHLVVQQVPHAELGVEEQQAQHNVVHQLKQLGSFPRQDSRATGPVQQRGGEHEHQVLVERLPQAGQQLPRRRREVGLDLVAPQRGHPGAQNVQHREGQAERQVDGDGEDDREEGRLGEGLPRPQAVPERLQKQLAGATQDVGLGSVEAAHGQAVHRSASRAADFMQDLAPPWMTPRPSPPTPAAERAELNSPEELVASGC